MKLHLLLRRCSHVEPEGYRPGWMQLQLAYGHQGSNQTITGNQKMKKLFGLLFSLTICVSFAGCGGSGEPTSVMENAEQSAI